jgi:hypothetical protein
MNGDEKDTGSGAKGHKGGQGGQGGKLHPLHEMTKKKSLAAMHGKQGVAKAQAFLDNFLDDCRAERAKLSGKSAAEILAEVDLWINTLTAESANMAKELGS